MSAESLAFVMLGRTVTTEDCSGEPGDFAALIRFQPAGFNFQPAHIGRLFSEV